MIEFILNNKKIKSEIKNGYSLLDFIRKEQLLSGTKIGCREGDCGACSVLIGEIKNDKLSYQSIVSCLTPLINVHGKHVVTIEGLNQQHLAPIQQSIVDNAATQCGFCTPGFVISFYSHILSNAKSEALESIAGNICRCTGYTSLKKVAKEIESLSDKLDKNNIIDCLVDEKWIPEYFLNIQKRLSEIPAFEIDLNKNGQLIGGGTDLLVQVPDSIRNRNVIPVEQLIPKGISINMEKIRIGAGTIITDFFNNELIKSKFPQISYVSTLIASSQIRNTGTLAGNIVNASPIGDLSILFLALNARLVLKNKSGEERQMNLKDFFIAYKRIDLYENEFIYYIEIDDPGKYKLNFEKVSKRTYLDIASVNTAMSVLMNNGTIENIHIAFGGIAPYPLYMKQSVDFLCGKKLNKDLLIAAIELLQKEITPIDDIRGSIAYKRLLSRQLFLAHFHKLFPKLIGTNDLKQIMNNNQMYNEEY